MSSIALTPAEESLLNVVLRLDRSWQPAVKRADVTITSRRSDRPYDIKFDIAPSDTRPATTSSWLPLAAIRVTQPFATEQEWEAICALSDFPDMAAEGDWSAFRDSSKESVWQMFEICRPIIERPVRMKKIVISVDFTAEVPVGALIEPITLELDVAAIRIDGEDGPLPASKITGYCTQFIDEES